MHEFDPSERLRCTDPVDIHEFFADEIAEQNLKPGDDCPEDDCTGKLVTVGCGGEDFDADPKKNIGVAVTNKIAAAVEAGTLFAPVAKVANDIVDYSQTTEGQNSFAENPQQLFIVYCGQLLQAVSKAVKLNTAEKRYFENTFYGVRPDIVAAVFAGEPDAYGKNPLIDLLVGFCPQVWHKLDRNAEPDTFFDALLKPFVEAVRVVHNREVLVLDLFRQRCVKRNGNEVNPSCKPLEKVDIVFGEFLFNHVFAFLVGLFQREFGRNVIAFIDLDLDYPKVPAASNVVDKRYLQYSRRALKNLAWNGDGKMIHNRFYHPTMMARHWLHPDKQETLLLQAIAMLGTTVGYPKQLPSDSLVPSSREYKDLARLLQVGKTVADEMAARWKHAAAFYAPGAEALRDYAAVPSRVLKIYTAVNGSKGGKAAIEKETGAAWESMKASERYQAGETNVKFPSPAVNDSIDASRRYKAGETNVKFPSPAVNDSIDASRRYKAGETNVKFPSPAINDSIDASRRYKAGETNLKFPSPAINDNIERRRTSVENRVQLRRTIRDSDIPLVLETREAGNEVGVIVFARRDSSGWDVVLSGEMAKKEFGWQPRPPKTEGSSKKSDGDSENDGLRWSSAGDAVHFFVQPLGDRPMFVTKNIVRTANGKEVILRFLNNVEKDLAERLLREQANKAGPSAGNRQTTTETDDNPRPVPSKKRAATDSEATTGTKRPRKANETTENATADDTPASASVACVFEGCPQVCKNKVKLLQHYGAAHLSGLHRLVKVEEGARRVSCTFEGCTFSTTYSSAKNALVHAMSKLKEHQRAEHTTGAQKRDLQKIADME